MNSFKFKIHGASPMLMHNNTLANPLHELTKAHKKLTSKKDPTDAEQEEIYRSSWRAALYYDDDIGIYMPAVNLKACFCEGGTVHKHKAPMKRSVQIIQDKIPLKYEGPKDPEQLWHNKDFVDLRAVRVGGISKSTIMRCRPVFREWSLESELMYSTVDKVNLSDIKTAMENAGVLYGLGDFRVYNGGNFGRFDVEFLN